MVPVSRQLDQNFTEHSPAHQSKTPIFPAASPSHPEAGIGLLSSFTRGQTVEARIITIPQQLETKPHHRKLTRMKKQRVLSHMKGQGKTPEKHMNEVVMGNLPEKEFRIMIVEMI